MNMYEYTEACLELLDKLTSADSLDMTEEEMNQILNDTLEAMGLNEKLDVCGKYIRELGAIAENLRNEEKRIAELRHSVEKKEACIKKNIMMFLDATVDGKAQTELFRFSIRKSEIVDVDDIDKIPDEYSNITKTADKTKIKEAIKSGITIDGAKITTNRSVIIR